MHALFEKFWNSYDQEDKWKRSKWRTKKYFESMNEDWQQLAVERANNHESERDPYWFLQDEDFLRVGASANTKIEDSPHWLTNEDQYTLMQAGSVLAFCQKPDGKGFGTVTQADAERFNLHKVSDVKLK